VWGRARACQIRVVDIAKERRKGKWMKKSRRERGRK
jgi:hypothetical protein